MNQEVRDKLWTLRNKAPLPPLDASQSYSSPARLLLIYLECAVASLERAKADAENMIPERTKSALLMAEKHGPAEREDIAEHKEAVRIFDIIRTHYEWLRTDLELLTNLGKVQLPRDLSTRKQRRH